MTKSNAIIKLEYPREENMKDESQEEHPCRFRGRCPVGGPGCRDKSDDDLREKCAAGFFAKFEAEEASAPTPNNKRR